MRDVLTGFIGTTICSPTTPDLSPQSTCLVSVRSTLISHMGRIDEQGNVHGFRIESSARSSMDSTAP
jgi:hypothetical protein